MNTPERLEWIDYSRAISIILIILMHCQYLTLNTPYGGIPPEQSVTLYQLIANTSLYHYASTFIFGILYYIPVPMLFLISGMVYSISNTKSYGALVKTKFKRLIVPFILTTLFLTIPLKYVSGYWDNSDNIINDIIKGQFLLMGNSHLWFLVSLFLMFILYPPLIKLCTARSKHPQLPITIISLVLCSSSFLFPEFLSIKECCHYFIFFVLGANPKTLSTIQQILNRIDRRKTILYLATLIIIIAITYLASAKLWHLSPHIIHPMTLLVIGLTGSLSIFIIIQRLIATTKIAHCKIASFLKRNSFGFYLYSDQFNYLMIYLSTTPIGISIIDNKFGYIIHFSTRFIITTLFPAIIILLLNKLKSYRHQYIKR